MEGSDVDSVNALIGDIVIVGKGEVGVTVEGQNIVVSGTDHGSGGGADSPDIDSINTVTGTLTLQGAAGITIVDDTLDSDNPVLTNAAVFSCNAVCFVGLGNIALNVSANLSPIAVARNKPAAGCAASGLVLIA